MTDKTFAQSDQHADSGVDNVTREQGGQFIDEGEGYIQFGDPLENLHDVAPEAQVVDGGAGRINALQVTMDRSGADFIHAQKVFLTNAGAKEITGTSSKLIQSGVLSLKTERAELHQSSAVVANADTLTVDQGSVVFATAEQAHLGSGAEVSLLQSRSVKADGDVHAFMMFSKDVTAGGNVTSTVTAASAAAFGAVFGVIVVLLSRLLGRGKD